MGPGRRAHRSEGPGKQRQSPVEAGRTKARRTAELHPLALLDYETEQEEVVLTGAKTKPG